LHLAMHLCTWLCLQVMETLSAIGCRVTVVGTLTLRWHGWLKFIAPNDMQIVTLVRLSFPVLRWLVCP
jgi:hypothetical protein